MQLDPADTIVAVASAAGAGARAIIRLSGHHSLGIARSLFHSDQQPAGGVRQLLSGEIRLPGLASTLPADLYVWPAPRSYTGQTIAEMHTIASPPLVEQIVIQCLAAGARAAGPGEFTLRGFLAGRFDLTRAEAVLAVIEAGSQDELKLALGQLAGGVAQPLRVLQDDLLNLLADVEAALDFTDEDIEFVSQRELLERLAKGMALVTLLQRQLDQRNAGRRPFRVVLAGRPNAGKSSLFNALAGTSIALVSPTPGTTRDYLVRRLTFGGVAVEVIDTAGRHIPSLPPLQQAIETQAQDLSRQQADHADLVLLCVEGGKANTEERDQLAADAAATAGLATKSDLFTPPEGWMAVSSVTREGLAALREFVADRARAQSRPALAPSWSRCRHHVEACLENLRRAHAVVLEEEPLEMLALELRSSLEELGAMVGTVYTDDLLDRVFSRFCIGK
jgi:tRNA modification GTPase